MVPRDDNSPMSERAQQAIRDGEAAWVRVSSGDWDLSAWQVMGTALTLLRQQTLHELGISAPYGRVYNKAFPKRLASTKFATMESVTRSNLLYLMEPENRIVLDRLLASWAPELRARRTHPTTLAQHVRAALKPKPEVKPATAPAQSAQPEIERLRKRVAELEAAPAPGEPAMTLDMISSKTGREQAEAFMRQHAKKMEAQMRQKEAEFQEQTRAASAKWFADLIVEYREKEKHYDLITSRWKGLMTRADYNSIMFCIHPDQYKNRTDKQRDAAQMLWRSLEKVLVKAEKPPRTQSSLPTREELLKRKAEHDAAKAAQRKH